MAAAQRPESTALATREQIAREIKSAPAGTIPAHVQHALDERKTANLVASQIAGMTWGKGLDQSTTRAIAEYARRYGIDPVTEIEVLGGRIYKNARYYQRRLAQLVADGVVESFTQKHIAHDARLDELAKLGGPESEWARTESSHRLKLRIQYNAPEKAQAAVLTTIRARGLSEPAVGVNWCGGGVRRSDPVGDAEPTKTAETRSMRRAMLNLAEMVPTLRVEEDRMGDDGMQLEEAIQEVRAQVRAQEAAMPQLPPRGHALQSIDADYGIEDEQSAGAAAVDASPDSAGDIPTPTRSGSVSPADASNSLFDERDLTPKARARNAVAEGH